MPALGLDGQNQLGDRRHPGHKRAHNQLPHAERQPQAARTRPPGRHHRGLPNGPAARGIYSWRPLATESRNSFAAASGDPSAGPMTMPSTKPRAVSHTRARSTMAAPDPPSTSNGWPNSGSSAGASTPRLRYIDAITVLPML